MKNIPDALLNGLSVEKRESSWRDSQEVHEPPSVITMVGCHAGGNVVAFVSGGKARTGQLGRDGELYAMYLRQETQRKGLGGLLVRQFVHELDTRRFGSMAIWVLALKPFKETL
jgi:GNAT superfamily N-acetyltransferase